MSNTDTRVTTAHAVATQEQSTGRPPTAADVARLARVSRSTVSLVLNNVPDSRMTSETRERVRAAAEQVGYVPHAAASALRGGHNNLVLIPFFNRPYSYALNVYYEALAGRLTDLGYMVMFHRDRMESGPDVVRQWAALRPIGVIAEAHRLDDQAREVLQKAGTRAILTGYVTGADQDAPAWLETAGTLAANHLLAGGHQWLGAVVPRDRELVPLGLRRLAGVEQAARIQGVPVERIDLALDGQEAAALAERWRRHPHPSGVFAYNDEYALLLMSALLRAGLAIPGDVAVVGCDNLRLCEFVLPPLTSITLHPELAGRAMGDRLHATIVGVPNQPTEPVEPTLIVRESA